MFAYTLRTVIAAALVAAPMMVGASATAAPVPPTAPPTPVTDNCPQRTAPAPPVDASEVPAPGHVAPAPLPVAQPPVGGAKLGNCGVVTASDRAAVPKGITSAGWLVADATNGTVLAAKDPHGRYRPASTIKMLLALVALRDLTLDTVVTGTVEDYSSEGDAAGIGPGGTYTVHDLLQGLVMVSGNDCANALARELGGPEVTLTKMNALAKDLDAKDTRATSPSGLDAPGMSSSPYDLALILRAGLNNPAFRELFSHTEAYFPGYPPLRDVPHDKPHKGYQMQTQNQLLLDGYPGTIAGKTGYTDDAKKTYVGAVKREDRTLIVVQMYGLNATDDLYWQQAKSLLDYGFSIPTSSAVGTLATANDNKTTQSRAEHNHQSADVNSTASDASDSDGSTLARIIFAIFGALIVIAALIAALKLNRRNRG